MTLMRVLIAVPRLAMPGGVANYYRTLRPYLDEQKVYFEIGNKFGDSGGWGAIRRLLADYWQFHRALRGPRVELVHINPSLGSRSVVRDGLLLLIAKAHGCPVVVFFRGWDPGCEAVIRRRFLWLFRAVYGRADAFILLSDEFRRALIEMGIDKPVFAETTVVDDAVFASVPAISMQSDAEADAPCSLLFLSRLDTGKGLSEALDAFAGLRKMWPGVTLTVAGDGPEKAVAEAAVARRGLTGVTFVGHIQGAVKDQAFQAADIFFFPTFYGEGMPNAVLEAMAFGLPVVTRPVGGVRDFFEDGRMGFISESADPAVYAELLSRLVSDPALRKRMGQYNRDFARKKFSASLVAGRLVSIYAKIAGKAG